MDDLDFVSDDEYVSEGAEYSPKSEYSKAKQADDAVRKVVENRSKEMVEGYWNTKITKEGLPIRTWINDSRKEFISSVIALRLLLYPEILEDETYRKKETTFDKEIETCFKKYAYEERVKHFELCEDKIQQKLAWRKTGITFIPKVGANLTIPDPNNPAMAVTGMGVWNEKVDAYYNELVLIYDKMFAELNSLIHRKNYFKVSFGF